jgi:hypothetical protein
MPRISIKARGSDNYRLGYQLADLGVVVQPQGRGDEGEELLAQALDIVRVHRMASS